MKIYTKTGDAGSTSLFGGKRVDKNSARIEAYGSIDELNSLIGIIIAQLRYSSSDGREITLKVDSPQGRIVKIMTRIQSELFVLGTDLATPYDVKVKIPRVTKSFITRLEKEIDLLEKKIPILKNFILPGGSKVGSKLHLARTVTRRAERRIVDLSGVEKINHNGLSYINRLSDLLFVMALYVNKEGNVKEIIWKGRTK